MKTQIECYSGSTYPEKPRAFYWNEQRYMVREIIQRRREPEGVGFLVSASPGEQIFDLFYIENEDEWRILPKGFSSSQKEPHTQNNQNIQGE